jgi:hypothetical protein
MKKLIVILATIGILIGCKAGDVVNNNGMLTAIELAGYNLGYYVGKSKTTSDDIAIADAYQLARTGQLSPEQIAEAYGKLKIDNPQLAGSLYIVLKNMGANFNTSGGLVDLSSIPIEYWDSAAAGYEAGFAVGKVNQKSKVKAVK